MTTPTSQTTASKPQSPAIYIVSGLVVLLAAGGFYWYYQSRKKKRKSDKQADPLAVIATATSYQTPPIIPRTTTIPSTSNRSGTTIKRGSRHPEVFRLQRYLKGKGAYLGRSGKNRDGIDGIFGRLTEKAARSITKKTVFTTADIDALVTT